MVANLSPEEYFRLSDGSVLKGLDDLKSFLKRNDEQLFREHVDGSRNDFYNWIRDCIRDEVLAESIRGCNSPGSMLTAINDSEHEESSVGNVDNDDTGDLFSGSNSLPEFSGSFTNSQSIDSRTTDSRPVSPKKTEVSAETHNQSDPAPKSSKKAVRAAITETPRRTQKPKKASKASGKSTKSKASKASSEKSKSKSSKKEDAFEYSFDLDAERADLDRIRERIARLNQEITSSAPAHAPKTNPAKKKAEQSKPGKSDSSKRKSTSKVSRSSGSNGTSRDQKPSKKSSNGKKSKSKYLEMPLIKEPKTVPDSSVKKEAKDTKRDNISSAEDADADLEHEMKNLYGQSINEAKRQKKEKEKKKKGGKRNRIFTRLIGKLTRAEKMVEDELPNLHEMEHGKKAQEAFNPYIQIDHPWNYHNHGFPDFVKGLLIGMLVGMLFLALFL